MSLSERNAKIYGAVETETFITFEGFCKKIYNTEQQEVEVFIDDKKVDTILANERISTIEDTYEVFDTEGFCFTYKLPKEYIGEKHKLEFKTIDGEQLIHSPFSTVDISNEKYNEYCFLESLNEPIDEDKIKNLYCPNSIGFLATEENLKDSIFIENINSFIQKYSNFKFIAYYLVNDLEKINIKLFNNKLTFVYLKKFSQIIDNNYLIILHVYSKIDNNILKIKKGKILHLHINSSRKKRIVENKYINSTNDVFNTSLNIRPFYEGMIEEDYNFKLLDLYISIKDTSFHKKILNNETNN